MSFYHLFVIVHVFSAILGIGPGFIMLPIVSRAETLPEIKMAFRIRKRIHLFVMAGGALLLLSGLGMGFFNPYLWQQFWYTASLVLFIIALSMGPLVLSPLTKPIQQLLAEHDGEDIPEPYEKLARKLFFYERVTNVIFLVIIFLMVTKPF